MSPTGVMRNALLQIDSNDYFGECRKARLVPEANIQTYPTLDPDGTLTDVDNPVWTLELEGVQDHSATGLARILTEGHGTEMELVLAPRNEDGFRQATVTFVAQAVPFGGTTGEWATFDVTLGIVGQPEFADVVVSP